MTRSSRGFPLLLLLPILAGCARPAVLQVEDPAPARPVDSVEVLLDVPERPFRTVALIRSPHQNAYRGIDALKRQVLQEAAELGADAVVLSFWGGTGSGDLTGITSSGEVVFVGGGSSETRLLGRAIQYTGPPPVENDR